MKTFLGFIVSATALIFCLGHNSAGAQEGVVNGDFELNALAPSWTQTGWTEANEIVLYLTKPGPESLTFRREIGPPKWDGAIEQMVYLQAGNKYLFSANVAAFYDDEP